MFFGLLFLSLSLSSFWNQVKNSIHWILLLSKCNKGAVWWHFFLRSLPVSRPDLSCKENKPQLFSKLQLCPTANPLIVINVLKVALCSTSGLHTARFSTSKPSSPFPQACTEVQASRVSQALLKESAGCGSILWSRHCYFSKLLFGALYSTGNVCFIHPNMVCHSWTPAGLWCFLLFPFTDTVWGQGMLFFPLSSPAPKSHLYSTVVKTCFPVWLLWSTVYPSSVCFFDVCRDHKLVHIKRVCMLRCLDLED